MMAEGKAELAVNALFGLIESMQRQHRAIHRERLELLKKVYGRSSERIDPNQLALVLQGMRDNQAEHDAEGKAKVDSDAELARATRLARPSRAGRSAVESGRLASRYRSIFREPRSR